MNNHGYNGWRNRETWLVNVHFGDFFSEIAAKGLEVSPELIESHINEYYDAFCKDLPIFITDFIDFGCIDTKELAEHYMDNAEGSDDAEEEED